MGSQRLCLFKQTTRIRNCLFNSYQKGLCSNWEAKRTTSRFWYQEGLCSNWKAQRTPKKRVKEAKVTCGHFSKSGFENHLCEFLILSVLHTTRIKSCIFSE